ncbi:18681_t:CDS:2, partial [Entrophospora sp. SA101]
MFLTTIKLRIKNNNPIVEKFSEKNTVDSNDNDNSNNNKSEVITGTLTELKSDENGGKEYQSVNEGRSIHNIVPNSEIKTSRINRSKNSNIVPFTFHWKDGGNKVFVTGDFNNWSASKHEMKRIPKTNNFVAMIDIDSTKQHEFKFIVDGDWKFSRDFETHHDE